MSKVALLAAALALAPLPALCQGTQGGKPAGMAPQATEEGTQKQGGGNELSDILDRLSHSQLKDRLEAAAERVGDACGDDIAELCGSIEPGGGRIISCVREHQELLSRRCRLTLFVAARRIKQAVSNFAEECGDALRAQCGNADKIGECAEQKSASISPACHTFVQVLHHAGQKLSNLKGVTVYSSDGKDVGQVVEATRGPDGKIQSVQIQIGRLLGLGDKVVSISGDRLRELGDRLQVQMGADQFGTLPEAK